MSPIIWAATFMAAMGFLIALMPVDRPNALPITAKKEVSALSHPIDTPLDFSSIAKIFDKSALPPLDLTAPPPVLPFAALGEVQLIGITRMNEQAFALFSHQGQKLERQTNGQVAGFKILAISPRGVTLQSGADTTELLLPPAEPGGG